HPYIYTLKQMFAPRVEEEESIDSYLDLVYRPLIEKYDLENTDDNSNSSFISDNDDILTAENRQHLQHLY
ncbi:16944_t:CDS:1, partial [Cetraspora pellucida]